MAYLTRYLIEEHLNIPIEEITDRVNADILWKHRLRPPATVHGWDFMELVQHAYPGQFFAWEFRQVSNGYWKGEKGRQRAIEAIKYVIEEKCRIPYHEIPQCINYRFVKEHRLLGTLNVFGHSPYQVVDNIYPDQFQPWEFANSYRGSLMVSQIVRYELNDPSLDTRCIYIPAVELPQRIRFFSRMLAHSQNFTCMFK
ncbi:hypothetical protein [Paenibacillus sp. LHD-38]|uniref:hypothetical protein n=1 Tax=Paenibacillus sp. LHD-38 TaxID=3072143 RepID=UPI00280EB006|nr:hypothetical protein [Paenibacillus sp. LHD-38]MDQ8739473.1 hypothetical protein [Paenibacillus sp. LHD-38]